VQPSGLRYVQKIILLSHKCREFKFGASPREDCSSSSPCAQAIEPLPSNFEAAGSVIENRLQTISTNICVFKTLVTGQSNTHTITPPHSSTAAVSLSDEMATPSTTPLPSSSVKLVLLGEAAVGKVKSHQRPGRLPAQTLTWPSPPSFSGLLITTSKRTKSQLLEVSQAYITIARYMEADVFLYSCLFNTKM
jgi:hypothetical protein